MENQLVFMPDCIKSEPYTNSSIVADYAKIRHHSVQQLIVKHEKDLKEFGAISAFEMRKLEKAGRPEIVYRLNEQQATLLISYMKNTKPVRRFKKALVKEFFAMRTELAKRRINRDMLKDTHKNLAEVVKHIPPHNSSKYDYAKYNSLGYIILFGCSAAKLKKQRGANNNAAAADYLSSDEIEQLDCIIDKICTCLELGMEYQEIKTRLMQTYNNKNKEVNND